MHNVRSGCWCRVTRPWQRAAPDLASAINSHCRLVYGSICRSHVLNTSSLSLRTAQHPQCPHVPPPHPPQPPTSKSAPSGRGSLWYLYSSFLALLFFLPILLVPLFLHLPSLLPAPSPACSCLGAAVLKWVTNTAKEAQAASRFVQSSGPSTPWTLTDERRHCDNHVHVSLLPPIWSFQFEKLKILRLKFKFQE